MTASHASRRWLTRIAGLTGLLLMLGTTTGCDSLKETFDKARMKVLGVTVTHPERESAEWVLKQAIEAARDKNAERGWKKFQLLLHTSEQTPNALRGWYTGAWKRMRRQADDYIQEDGVSFRILDYKKMMTSRNKLAGVDYYIESKKKEAPTPCAVYIDHKQGDKWRIRRCSL